VPHAILESMRSHGGAMFRTRMEDLRALQHHVVYERRRECVWNHERPLADEHAICLAAALWAWLVNGRGKF
jgi:hypothetical protein